MATVGAFGGIMAGFGHISVLGLGAKASSLKGIKATVGGKEVDSGKYLSDNIRLSNSLTTSVNSTIGYYPVVFEQEVNLDCWSCYGNW